MKHRPGNETKLRILAVERILCNGMKTRKEIERELFDDYHIEVDRKTLYDDIAVLSMYMPLKTGYRDVQGKPMTYGLESSEE